MGTPHLETERIEVPCSACGELILKQATKCKHCGESVGQNKQQSAKGKSVGLLLGAGILLFPYLFSWLTLREGHSAKSRLISFGWMAILLISILNNGSRTHNAPLASSGLQAVTNQNNNTSTPPANELGIWTVDHYVDKFGDKTKEGFIANKQKIRGTFSNSATTNSDLLADFLLDDRKNMSIMLYEYAGKNPVKQYGTTGYRVMIKDKNGKKSELSAINYSSDRLRIDPSQASKLHNALKLGGNVQFVIYESENRINTYSFILENADGYEKAYAQLHPPKK